jgi:hypothetical protein
VDDKLPSLCYPINSIYNTVSPYTSTYVSCHFRPLVKYAQPYVLAAQPYVKRSVDVYKARVQPRVAKLASRAYILVEPYQSKALNFYRERVLPHYEKAVQTHYRYAVPVYVKSQKAVYDFYRLYAVPCYQRIRPRLERIVQILVVKVGPKVHAVSDRTWHVISKYSAKGFDWFTTVVSPKLRSVYYDAVEPQINKIHDRLVHQKTDPPNGLSSNGVPNGVPAGVSAQPTATIKTDSSTVVSTSTSSTSTSSIAPLTISTESAAVDALNLTLASISNELSRWKQIVDDTTREAFATFLDDVEMEKHHLIETSKPKFTELLQDLQHRESQAFKELGNLVNTIEQDGTAPTQIQEAFRHHADLIREAALAVRLESETFANEILNKTEEIRRLTVEVLDEFAEVTLQEIGRKMVSVDSITITMSNGDKGPNWKDWKEYRSLKDRLLNARQEIVEHNINTADVNKVLREAQETANYLAKEAAQYLSSLRAKADFTFQERLKKKAKQLEDQGVTPQDEEIPENVEFYEELEEQYHTELVTPEVTSESPERISEDSPEETSMELHKETNQTPVAEPLASATDGAGANFVIQEEIQDEPSEITITQTILETLADTKASSSP